VSAAAPFSTVRRIRQRHVEWVADRLTPRDQHILMDVRQVRLLTGAQIERLHFYDLSGRSRSVVRWRVLKRLTDWRVLLPLPRRVGGPAGSAVTAYTLDTVGLALLPLLAQDSTHQLSLRRPGTPGERFLRHVLAVSELYVTLIEATRNSTTQLVDFRAEPAAWMPNGLGGWLKPDAYLRLAAGDIEDCWAVEVDKATEHLPTLKRKVQAYLDFHQRGQLGPHDVMPRVLITVPDTKRQDAVSVMLDQLPSPGDSLLHVITEEHAPRYLFEALCN
jgi:hypothetical protein